MSAEPPLKARILWICLSPAPVLRLDPRMPGRVISDLSRIVIGLLSRPLTLLEHPASGMGAAAHILCTLAHLPRLSSIFRLFSPLFLPLRRPDT